MNGGHPDLTISCRDWQLVDLSFELRLEVGLEIIYVKYRFLSANLLFPTEPHRLRESHLAREI